MKELQQLAGEYYKSGNMEQAVHTYAEILHLEPNDITALFMLGLINAGAGNFPAAIDYFREVVKINPHHAGAHYNLGNVYRDTGNMHEALKSYQKALRIDPNYAEVYVNLGIIFRLLRRYKEESACYQKALQINPSSAEALFNLGHSFFEREDFDKALACYQKVVQLNPASVNAYMSLGLILRIKGRNEEAIACYQNAILLNPEDATSHWHLSNMLLLTGRYTEGWEEFEWFRKAGGYSERQRQFAQPLWDGGNVEGLTILLHAEEGFGDTIQFIRYAPLIAQRGAKVIVESQRELTSLIRNMPGIQRVISAGDKLPSFDTHCPLMSLSRVFGTTLDNIPAQVPYLHADGSSAEKWRKRLQNDTSRLKIGLIWSGGGLPFRKSTSLDMFAPLAKLGDITFYSLQKGAPAEQAKNAPEGVRLIDYTEELHDFSDTAALLTNLDLVISVDTAVAHLAGALAKPVWVLLPFVPDWRWLLKRDDSPWYPTMRLFRQPALGDWLSVTRLIMEWVNEKLQEKAMLS